MDDDELKFFDTALSWNFSQTGAIPATGQLTLIPQGDTESTREGRQALVEGIEIRAQVSFTPGALGTAIANAHVFLVLDTQTNGAAASITDIFTTTDMRYALQNLNNSERFTIIKHWGFLFEPEAGATTAYNQSVEQIEYYKEVDVLVNWKGATGALTELTTNNLFFVAGCNPSADGLVGWAGVCRLLFAD